MFIPHPFELPPLPSMLADALRALRTLLFDPRSFFETHPPDESLGGAAKVAALVAVGSTLAFLFAGVYLASQIDATVTVTTMEPWPDSTCASFAEMNDSSDVDTVPEPCTIDEPRTRQVSVGQKLRSAIFSRAPLIFFGTLLGWLLVAVGLHAVSAFTKGSGSFTGTLSVVGWAMPAQFAQTVLSIAGLVLAVSATSFSNDPQVLAEQLRTLAAAPAGVLGVFGTLVGVGWQAAIWTHGLRKSQDAPLESAAVAAAVVGVVLFVTTVL